VMSAAMAMEATCAGIHHKKTPEIGGRETCGQPQLPTES